MEQEQLNKIFNMLEEIIKKQNELSQKIENFYRYNDIFPKLILFLIVLIAVYFLFKKYLPIKRYFLNIISSVSNLNQTDKKVQDSFDKIICDDISQILAGHLPNNKISNLINALINKTDFPETEKLYVIEYTLESNDSKTIKIRLSAVLKENKSYIERSKERFFDFDYLPKDIMEAYINSSNNKIRIELYRKVEKC